jgi:hypothetical protein
LAIIEAGKNFEFVWFLTIAAVGLYYLWQGIQGKTYKVRLLPQIQAIDDAIDRAVEMGRPVWACPGGVSRFSGTLVDMTIVGLNVMRYVIKKSLQKGAAIKCICPCKTGSQPIIDGIYREQCVAQGKPEAYSRDNDYYWGDGVRSWNLGVMTAVEDDNPALFVDVGAWTSDCDLTGNAWVREVGGIVIAGTMRWHHQGVMALISDYPLFISEIHGAGAYASEDPKVLATVMSADILALLEVAMLLVIGVAVAAGITSTDGIFKL